MSLSRKERRERRQRALDYLEQYRAGHSPEEVRRHVRAQRFPSGRPSHGGANRSSNVKREIGLRVTPVTLCVTCGGVTPEVAAFTSLFQLCTCP